MAFNSPRAIQKKKCLRSQSTNRRRCPSQGFLGSHTCTWLLNQGTGYHLTQRRSLLPSGADQSKHMPSLSPQGTNWLNSTAFCKSEGLLPEKEKEELGVRPVLPRNSPDAGCRAQTHNIPRVQKRPDPFPPRALPTPSVKIFAPATLHATAKTKALTTTTCETKCQHQ